METVIITMLEFMNFAGYKHRNFSRCERNSEVPTSRNLIPWMDKSCFIEEIARLFGSQWFIESEF